MDNRGTTRGLTRDKIAALERRKAVIEARLKQVQGREKASRRRDDTWLKVLIGAAFLVDARHHPGLAHTIHTTLNRAIVKPRDREFLTRMGWLHDRPSEED